MVTLSSGPCGECLYPLVSSPTLRAVSELVATSRCRPGQQHNFAAKSAPVDAGVDFARGRERQSVDHDRMKDARVQQLEQRRHVGLEFLRVSRSTCRDAVEDGATAAEKEAECAPQLESGQAESRGSQAFATDCHGLRPVTNEQPSGRETCERAAEMRAAEPPVRYLVGTPKGRLSKLEQSLAAQPWQQARQGVQVKLLAQDGEFYVFAESADRVLKERAMRRRQLKWLWRRLHELAAMKTTREQLLMKLGAARAKAPVGWRLVDVKVEKASAAFTFTLNRDKLRKVRRREGRYLLRTNLTESDPATLWQYYIQLVAVEEAFKNLKADLAIRPVFHQEERRIEAHIFIAFLAYCLYVTLQRRLHALAPGLTARSALEKFAAVQMIDVHLPTTDGRELVLTRYTQPEPELQLLINQLKFQLPPQPPPRIAAANPTQQHLP